MSYKVTDIQEATIFINAKINQNFMYVGRLYSKYGFYTAYRYDTRSVVDMPLEATIIPCVVEEITVREV